MELLPIKSLFRLSLRMVTGFAQSLIKLSGLNWTAPDYSTLCRRQKHITIDESKKDQIPLSIVMKGFVAQRFKK
jgi:hypothetical protein